MTPAPIDCPADYDPSQTRVVLGGSPYQIDTCAETGVRTETVGTVHTYGGPTLEDCARRGDREVAIPLKAPINIWMRADLLARITELERENADLRRERDALVKAQSDWRSA